MDKQRREFKFYPLQDFEWWREERDEETGELIHREMIGAYHVGASYNCTRQPVHDALYARCIQWQKQKKIRISFLQPTETFMMVTPQEKEDGDST